MLFDSHCHLNHPLLLPRLPELLAEAAGAGIGGFLVPGVDAAGWEQIADLARRFPQVRPAYGLHPGRAHELTAESLDRLRGHLRNATALGEIGLDYTLPVPRPLQQEAFRAQLALAREFRLPVLIHCRRAFADCLLLLKAAGVSRGVMHAFSGSVESARECLKLGLQIGVAGTVTYPNAVRLPEVVRLLPLERLLLETDAPDLTPSRFRGAPNRPAHLVETALRVAELKGVELSALSQATTRTASTLFELGTLCS